FLVNYGFVPALFGHMQHLWTVPSSLFIHGSAAHVLGNMYFLYTFGDNVEEVLGPWKFLLFYRLCGRGRTLRGQYGLAHTHDWRERRYLRASGSLFVPFSSPENLVFVPRLADQSERGLLSA